MDKKICIALLCFLLVCSCNKTPTDLPLTDDTAKNSNMIKAFIPSGTLASNAILKMEQEGFTCKTMRDEKVRSSNDTIQANKNSNVDFVWCERKTWIVIPRRWQVIMSLDSEDRVENISVTGSLVGS